MKLSIESSVFMIFLIFCLFVLSLVFFESSITGNVLVGKGESCFKQSHDKFKAGVAVLNYTRYIDYCINKTLLVEYYCGTDDERNNLFREEISCNCIPEKMNIGLGGACKPTKEDLEQIKENDTNCKEEDNILTIKIEGNIVIQRESLCHDNKAIHYSCEKINNIDITELDLNEINNIIKTTQYCEESRKICYKGQCIDEYGFNKEPIITLSPQSLKEGDTLDIQIFDPEKPKDDFITLLINIFTDDKIIRKEIVLLRKSVYFYQGKIDKVPPGRINIFYIINNSTPQSRSIEIKGEKQYIYDKETELHYIKEEIIPNISDKDFQEIMQKLNINFNQPNFNSFKQIIISSKQINKSIELENINNKILQKSLLMFKSKFIGACNTIGRRFDKNVKIIFETKINSIKDIKTFFNVEEYCSCRIIRNEDDEFRINCHDIEFDVFR